MQTAPFVLHHEKPRMGPAAAVSLTSHVLLLGGLMLLRSMPHASNAIAAIPDQLHRGIVFLSDPGVGGGGGGGGNHSAAPARAATAPGRDPLTMPVQRPQAIEPSATPIDVPPTPPQPDIQVQPMALGLATLPGLSNALPGPSTNSLGSGANDGAGTGDGRGDGPGKGNGLGPGSGRNFGGAIPGPGNGVTTPVLLREVTPGYTSDAMRAKVQGSVLVECIVNPDGTVGDARVARSLDDVFGLDQEALKAARQWLFRPGTFHVTADPVRITIELTFTLR